MSSPAAPPAGGLPHTSVNAPNTPGSEITRDGPYHVVNSDTCSTGDYTPAKCRKCKVVADPSHVTNGPRESLQVWCEIHCPACIVFRIRK